jgi:hypothetical protein
VLSRKQSSDYYIGVDFMEQSPSAKLQFVVGDIGYAFNNDIGIFYDFIGKMYIQYLSFHEGNFIKGTK